MLADMGGYSSESCGMFLNQSDLKMSIRVYLDDERLTPDGWLRTYWPNEVIALFKTGLVCEISLDHDLCDDLRGTGLMGPSSFCVGFALENKM
jgi:hypothetical protein